MFITRRKFFKWLGISAAAVGVVPVVSAIPKTAARTDMGSSNLTADMIARAAVRQTEIVRLAVGDVVTIPGFRGNRVIVREVIG